MTLFLTAHRRDHRPAAPLTASRSLVQGGRGRGGRTFREGRRCRRRRRHHDNCCLAGGPHRVMG